MNKPSDRPSDKFARARNDAREACARLDAAVLGAAPERAPLVELRDALLAVQDKPMHEDVRYVHIVVCDALAILIGHKADRRGHRGNW